MTIHKYIPCLLAAAIIGLGSGACKPKAAEEPGAPKSAEEAAPSSQ